MCCKYWKLTLAGLTLTSLTLLAVAQNKPASTEHASLPINPDPFVVQDPAMSAVDPNDPTMLIRRWLADPRSRAKNERADNAWGVDAPVGVPVFGPLSMSTDINLLI
jgi:hypothetical protein